jgi:hypothetical protein
MLPAQTLKRAQDQPQEQYLDQSWGTSAPASPGIAILLEGELTMGGTNTPRGAVSQGNKSAPVTSC